MKRFDSIRARLTAARRPGLRLRLRRRAAGERGVTLLEFALVLPMFMLLTVGALDFGRAVYVRNVLSNAARDGARFASVDPDNLDCIRRVATYLDSFANLEPANVTVTFPNGKEIDRPVVVTVNTVYRPLTGLVTDAIGVSEVPLRAEATMRIRHLARSASSCPEPQPTPQPSPTWPVQLKTPTPVPTRTPTPILTVTVLPTSTVVATPTP